MAEQAKCELCGRPLPPGEEMFKFHGYSGPCPAETEPSPNNPRKPFALNVTKEWCEKMAQREEGHDVSAGGVMAEQDVPTIDNSRIATWDDIKRLGQTINELMAENEGLIQERDQLAQENARLKAATWECGCGHVNGSNPAFCALCSRRPGE